MAAELRYNGEWLIPLQQGYRVSSGHSASLSGGHPTSALRRQAVTVAASYRLTDAAMIAWWWALYEVNRGTRWTAMLDTAGYQTTHNCIMLDSPQFPEFQGHTAVVTIRWQCFASAPVTAGYITSWPYPTSMDVDSVISESSPNDGGVLAMPPSAGVESAAVAALILSGGEIKSARVPVTADAESAHAAALIVSGGYLKSARIQYDARGDSQDYAVAAAHVLDGGIIETTAIFHDLRIYDTDAAACSAQILSGGVIA